MICPKCDGDVEMIYQDNSFSHAFGFEIIQFFYCPKCDYHIEAGEVEENEHKR